MNKKPTGLTGDQLDAINYRKNCAHSQDKSGMAMGLRIRMAALALFVGTGLSACGVYYTSPQVSDGSIFGGNDTDLKVNVVALTFESTTKANLDPYVPARLPLGFQPDAIARVTSQTVAVPPLPPAPAPATRPGSRPGFVADRLPPIEAPQPYTIGIADVLLLSADAGSATVQQLPALISAQSKRQGFVVQDDGAIAIPDAGRVRVAGLTMQDAEAEIFQALVAAGIDPSFSFEISEFNSQRVTVGGEVRQPQLVPITLKPLYLHEAVSAAGGAAVRYPDVAKIQLFRSGQTYQISMDRFRSDPAMRQYVLRDGDSVFVVSDFDEERARAAFSEMIQLRQQQSQQVNYQIQALNAQIQFERNEFEKAEAERELFKDRVELGAVKRDYAYLAGEVRRTSRVELPFEQKANLADVLFNKDAQGVDIREADYAEIYILRRSPNPEEAGLVRAYHLDASNAVNLSLATMFDIHAGDVVFVAEQRITAWNRVISQMVPSLLSTAANVATNIN